jgi:hypothetical protein
MKGYIEIYKNDIRKENLIFSDPNMIVDGAGEQIIDILTCLPAPSSLDYLVQTSSIADFGIKAITLGSAKGSENYNSYNVSSDGGPKDVSALVGVPPQPTDTTIQPATASGPGRLGHFLNYYNFSGSYSDLSEDQIQEHGCYLPSAGLYFDGSTFGHTHPGTVVNDMSGWQYGALNTSGAINSEGYILESTVARTSQTLSDASGGFIVSGGNYIMDVSSLRQVKYVLTLSYRDWKFLDYYYGGIGAIGLWTLDRDATLDKYNHESETGDINLYNVADTSRNPVFKLFAKKVFLPGGLKIPETLSNDDYITIQWGIKF